MAINQRQIASTLNLSVATISRSLKNDQAINPKTRALVRETARQLGYEMPTLQNQGIGQMNPFCVLIQTDTVPYSMNHFSPAGYMTGISEAAFRQHTSMIVHYVSFENRGHAADPEFLPKALTSGTAEGVILIHYYPDEVVKKFSESFPCVSISYDYRLPYIDVVSENNINGVGTLLRHLQDRGHQRIAFVGRDVHLYYTHRTRLSGFISGLLENNLEYLPEHIYNIDEKETEERLIKDIKNKAISAIVCGSEEQGYDLIKKFRRAEIRIPEDISLVGFNSMPPPEGFPQLTSMRNPSEQIGLTAVAALKERIAHQDMPAQRIFIDCAFVEGKTVKSI